MAIRPLYPEKLQAGQPTVSDKVWTSGSKLNSFNKIGGFLNLFFAVGA